MPIAVLSLLGDFGSRAAVTVETSLLVETTPPGASIRIGGRQCVSDCRIGLPAGTYEVLAVLDGYKPSATKVSISPGSPASVQLVLQPVQPSLRIVTDLESGNVIRGDQPGLELQQGQLVLDGLAPGRHDIRVVAGSGEAAFSFETMPAPPARIDSVTARNLFAVLVSSSKDSAHIRTSGPAAKVALDGQPAGQEDAAGLDLRNVAPGHHELTIGEGARQRKLMAPFGPTPMLTVYLELDRGFGSLLVATGEDRASVFLNGRKHRGSTRGGQLRIPMLGVNTYAVRVAKEGFQEEPEQRVEIRQGQESRLEFQLRPIVQAAVLQIRGAAPLTRVALDETPLGVVGEDGAFFKSEIPPGEHVIELRRDNYTPRWIQRHFSAGETVVLEGADVAMERLPATLRISVTPPESRVQIKRAGELHGRQVRESTLRLTEGTYMVTASAPGRVERSETFQLSSGETRTVILNLPRDHVSQATLGMKDWENPGAWLSEGAWRVHRGGNFVLFGPTPLNGSFEFTVAKLRGDRLSWVLNYRDPRNYVLIELDERTLARYEIVDGRRRQLGGSTHSLGQEPFYTLRIDIAPGALVHRIMRNHAWAALDNWTWPGRDFTSGKFGFLIRGNDKVGLSNFSFQPR